MTRISSLTEYVLSPQAALVANLGLVFTGSILAMFGTVDLFTGVFIVLVGFAGIAVSIYGKRDV